MANDLLRIEDLAKRWEVTIRQARRTVLEGAVPMIELRRTGRNVSWSTTRFDARDVTAWEEARKRARTAEVVEGPPPRRGVVTRPARRFLGDY
ncbi:hypothetical protein [Paludisphaera rhizosphaerae]|uniref:hypothetical protein n=1 Tax=Paludisphaera rhizosphaerae TaxID=2711216 RepID=UPI0013EC6338|nr:hypothetical protein [Paludisphaera rhizosphaerae]